MLLFWNGTKVAIATNLPCQACAHVSRVCETHAKRKRTKSLCLVWNVIPMVPFLKPVDKLVEKSCAEVGPPIGMPLRMSIL